jgi:hypothetical protein
MIPCVGIPVTFGGPRLADPLAGFKGMQHRCILLSIPNDLQRLLSIVPFYPEQVYARRQGLH